MNDVSDGTNNTYLVGEKYLDVDKYRTGEDMGDDWSMYQGDDVDTIRWVTGWIVSDPVFRSPLRDQRAKDADHMFGSSHPKTWNVVFCNGSVRSVSYDIDPEIHRRLANRMDGLDVDVSDLNSTETKAGASGVK